MSNLTDLLQKAFPTATAKTSNETPISVGDLSRFKGQEISTYNPKTTTPVNPNPESALSKLFPKSEDLTYQQKNQNLNIQIPFTKGRVVSIPTPGASGQNELANLLGTIPATVIEMLPRAAVTVMQELKPSNFGKATTIQLDPVSSALYGSDEYTNVNTDIQKRLDNGDGILSSYLGAISGKTLDVAVGASVLAGGLRAVSGALARQDSIASIEAWKTLGSPSTEAELKANYTQLAKQLHPDLTGGSDSAFKIISQAKTTLDKTGLPSTLDLVKNDAAKYAEWLGRESQLSDPIFKANLELKNIQPENLNLPALPGYRPEGGIVQPKVGLSIAPIEPVGFGGLVPEELKPLAQKAQSMDEAKFVELFSAGLTGQNLTVQETAKNILNVMIKAGYDSPKTFYNEVSKLKPADVVPQTITKATGSLIENRPATIESPTALQLRKNQTVYQNVDEYISKKGLDPNSVMIVDNNNFIVENSAGINSILTDVPIKDFGKPKFETAGKYKKGRKITDPIEATLLPNGKYYITDGANRFTQALANGDKTIPTIIEVQGKNNPTLADITNRNKTISSVKPIVKSAKPIPLQKEGLSQQEPILPKSLSSMETIPPKEETVKSIKEDRVKIANEAGKYIQKEIDEVLAHESDTAVLETIIGGKKGIKGFSDSLKNQFVKWVNARSASKLSGFLMQKKFADLDKLGLDGIIKFQTEVAKEGRFADVKKYFDDKYQLLKENDINMGFKSDYLPQLWENPKQETLNTLFMQRGLTRTPSFTLSSVLRDYVEGLELGLKPRYNTISDLVGWYEKMADKSIADVNYFKYLGDNRFILPRSLAPRGWKSLNPDGFPSRSLRINNTVYNGTFFSPPDLADAINNYLVEPPTNLLQQISKFASFAKNLVLSSGIPYTGINAHGLNILMRHMLDSKNIVSGFLSGANYLLRPNVAAKDLQSMGERAVFAVKHGLTISTEEHIIDRFVAEASKDLPQNFVVGKLKVTRDKFLELTSKMFETPLFSKIIPAIKVRHFNTIFNDLKKYYPEEEAANISAEITNGLFGGVNWEAMGRGRITRQLLQSIILAPDWAETQIKTGAGLVKGIVKPFDKKNQAYQRVFANLLLAYISANVLNYMVSGHAIWDNDSGHGFEIDMGKMQDGKKAYFRPFGTAADFVRLPFDMATSLAKGDLTALTKVIRNRLSIPLASGVSLIFNTDYAGNPIMGKDKYGRPIPVKQQIGGIASQVGNVVIPQYGQAGLDLASGRIGWQDALSQSLELPFRFSYPPKSTAPASLNSLYNPSPSKTTTSLSNLFKAKKATPVGSLGSLFKK